MWTKDMVGEAIKKVKKEAANDEDFRDLCKLSIHGAIKEVMKKEVPLSTKINVVDNTGYHMMVVLPPLEMEESELMETELESVAGGSKASDMANLSNFFSDVDRSIGQVFEKDYRK